LKDRDIAVFRLEVRIDTTSAAGELIFHVFDAIAHFERRLIAKRTKNGIAARARGKRPGRHSGRAEKIAASSKLIEADLLPTAAAKQLGYGRSAVYREVEPINPPCVPCLEKGS
jgi:DNA invertase Pin-like site-specific DNA recombinase